MTLAAVRGDVHGGVPNIESKSERWPPTRLKRQEMPERVWSKDQYYGSMALCCPPGYAVTI